MDRLVTMDKEQFIARLQAEFRWTMEQVAAAVNQAPDGNAEAVMALEALQQSNLWDKYRATALCRRN